MSFDSVHDDDNGDGLELSDRTSHEQAKHDSAPFLSSTDSKPFDHASKVESSLPIVDGVEPRVMSKSMSFVAFAAALAIVWTVATTRNGHWRDSVSPATTSPIFSATCAKTNTMSNLHCISSPDTVGNVGDDSSIVLDAQGHPVIAYWDGFDHGGALKVLHCGNPQCTRDNIITIPDADLGMSGGGTSIVLDIDGNPVVSYYQYKYGPTLKVLHCRNPSCSGDQNVIAFPISNATEAYGSQTSLVLDNEGRPIVAFRDSTKNTLAVLHCGNPDCTPADENSLVWPDNPSDKCQSAWYNAMALDSLGNPIIASNTGAKAKDRCLKILHCTNPSCSDRKKNVIATIDADLGSAGGFLSMALGSHDHPVVSYYNGSQIWEGGTYRKAGSNSFRLSVLFCGNPSCTQDNIIATPDMTGYGGRYSSLALDNDYHPVVAYYQSNGSFAGHLNILRCGDSLCSSTNQTTIVSPDNPGKEGNAGVRPSMVLSAQGYPIVAYYEERHRDLKVLYCGNEDCS